MADTTISITIPEAQWSTVQAAFATADEDGNAITIDADYVKNTFLNTLKSKVRTYDKKRASVTYSTFSPS